MSDFQWRLARIAAISALLSLIFIAGFYVAEL